MRERRIHPRAIGVLQASWHQGRVSGQAQIANLSAGGCLLEPKELNPPAGRIRVHVGLPRTGGFWLSGDVVHARTDGGFGVRFVDLTEESRAVLNQAVDYLSAAMSS